MRSSPLVRTLKYSRKALKPTARTLPITWFVIRFYSQTFSIKYFYSANMLLLRYISGVPIQYVRYTTSSVFFFFYTRVCVRVVLYILYSDECAGIRSLRCTRWALLEFDHELVSATEFIYNTYYKLAAVHVIDPFGAIRSFFSRTHVRSSNRYFPDKDISPTFTVCTYYPYDNISM